MSEEYPNNVPEDVVVSVCVITYNHADYIGQCLESILMQKTSFPFEICIGEDESSDDTRERCMEYARKYPDRIRLFLRSRKDVEYVKDRPTGKANHAKTYRACRGKYVAYCEGDDFWIDLHKLQKQYDYLEAHPEVPLVTTRFLNWQVNNPKNTYVLPQLKYKEPLRKEHFIQSMEIPSFGTWFARNGVLDYDSDFLREVAQGDRARILVLLEEEDGIHMLDDVTTAYRISATGTYSSLTTTKKLKLRLDFWEAYAKRCRKRDDMPTLRLAEARIKMLNRYIRVAEMKDGFSKKIALLFLLLSNPRELRVILEKKFK